MKKTEERIDVLQENGLRTGDILTRKEIHQKGAIHRAVHLYLLDHSGKNILLQQRSTQTDHYPNRYSIAVTGHINAGESSHQGVKRELREELGLDPKSIDLTFLFSFRQDATLTATYIDRQFNDVYIGFINKMAIKDMHCDQQEVKKVLWVALEKFIKKTTEKNGLLAPVYEPACNDVVYFLKKLLKNN